MASRSEDDAVSKVKWIRLFALVFGSAFFLLMYSVLSLRVAEWDSQKSAGASNAALLMIILCLSLQPVLAWTFEKGSLARAVRIFSVPIASATRPRWWRLCLSLAASVVSTMIASAILWFATGLVPPFGSLVDVLARWLQSLYQ